MQVSALKSAEAVELFIAAAPEPDDAAGQAEKTFVHVARTLRSSGARILRERIFVTPGAHESVLPVRAAAYGDLDDGVAPTVLQVSPGAGGPLPGVEVHAVVGGPAPEVVRLDGVPLGRIVRMDDYAFLTASGLAGPGGAAAVDQARAMFAKALRITQQAGGSMLSVDRTWMWLTDTLSWYDDFNTVRNSFFHDCGLLNGSLSHQLPASTGVGIGPADGGCCTMDLVATIEFSGTTKQPLLAGGNQGSAFDYGSAFSRALRAKAPAGEVVYVSGTAAIDADGKTVYVDDAPGQIEDTIANVRAVLANMDCTDRDVVHGIVYCKTEAVERIFREQFDSLPWPRIVLVCDICRADLLFEIEVTACPGSRRC